MSSEPNVRKPVPKSAITAAQKRKWLRALRSGKFSQTQCQLRDTDGYCCLGVFCEANGLKFEDGDTGKSTGPWTLLRGIPEKTRCQLITFNDVEKWSFEQIADWVAKNVRARK